MAGRQIQMNVLISEAENMAFRRDAGRHGLSLAGLVRLRMRAGLPQLEQALLMGNPQGGRVDVAPPRVVERALEPEAPSLLAEDAEYLREVAQAVKEGALVKKREGQ